MPSSLRQVSYSPAFTLVPTYECFNRCTYCNFRVDPGRDDWLTLIEAERKLRALSHQGVIEILILSGEVHPQSARRQAWLQRIYDLGELALSLGFLPHTNVGPLSLAEMEWLKSVNVSMGLMLEQVTPALLETVHRHAPSKLPELRLEQLIQAGKLGIPFTTGILLGIGESRTDRKESLETIAQIHHQWGHIQEVILQPHSPGQSQSWQGDALSGKDLIDTVELARRILPEEIPLQIPPNLVNQPDLLLACLDAGARDLGGIGPIDEVNPDYPHPSVEGLRQVLEPADWQLVPRLPVYPQYDRTLPPPLQAAVQRWRANLVIPSLT